MNTRGYTLLSPRLESGQGVPSKTGGGTYICPFSSIRASAGLAGWSGGGVTAGTGQVRGEEHRKSEIQYIRRAYMHMLCACTHVSDSFTKTIGPRPGPGPLLP